MGQVRLRTKFLLSLLAISASLTTATLLIVRYSVQKQMRSALQQDLNNSVKTYESFERQREDMLTRSAELLANLPNVRALMTTLDQPTIQDASAEVWRQSGSDLLVLASQTGEVLGLQSGNQGFDRKMAHELLGRSLAKRDAKDWWFGGGHLYEVWIQAIYFGHPSAETMLGFLVLGHEINERAAKNFGDIAASEVAFCAANTVVATTLPSIERSNLTRSIQDCGPDAAGSLREIQVGKERYVAATVNLSAGTDFPVSLTVLKSVDKATFFLAALNRVLLGLGLLSVIAGSILVFLISHTFTKPLASLVEGVRALEKGDFEFPLQTSSKDEVAEVTSAFDRMRVTLQKNQEEQTHLEVRLRQAHKMEAVGRLAGGVAHDFNNLLTIIRGHSDLLLDRLAAAESHRHSVEQIQKAAGRAVSMTRQLLAFSRMQALEPQILDLNAIVAEMGKMLPRLIGENIEYTFVPNTNLASVKADPGQIEQVILNLVVNSRDAMPSGGAVTVKTRDVSLNDVEVRKRPPVGGGNYVLLSVADTGHGMDEKTKTHIFEPFFTTKEVGKGTGLGLATVYGIVKQSGGFIWVESAVGKGTTFEIYLPQASERARRAAEPPKSRVTPRGTETVLVAEDEPGILELACEFLEVNGYSVLEAQDGVDALEVAARHQGKIHVLLADVIMPRMSGPELAKHLKNSRPDIKLLFMSGYSEYSTEDANQLGFTVPMLQKPFSVSTLVEKVREVLAKDSVQEIKDAEVRVT